LINSQLKGNRVFQENPVAGIASVEVIQQYANTVRVKIVGTEDIPTAKVISEDGQLLVQIGSERIVNQQSSPSDPQEMPTDPNQEMEPSELVVTATRTEEPLEDVPRSVTVISRDELQEQTNLTSNLGDILGQLVPGFGPPNQSNRTNAQTLRGRDPSVLIDGVPQTSNASVNVQLRYIDPSSIERLEIVRGPSAIYGGEATGGVVNIITRKPEAETVNFTTEIGTRAALGEFEEESFGSDLRATLTTSQDGIDFVGNVSFEDTGEFFDAEGDIIPPNNTALSNTDSFNVLGKLGFDLTEEQRLQFTVNHAQDNRKLNFLAAGNPEHPEGKAVAISQDVTFVNVDPPEIRSASVNAVYSHDDIFGSSLQAQLYYRASEQSTTPFPGDFAFINTNDEQTWGGRLQIEIPIAETAELLWGVDIEQQENGKNIFLQLDNEALDQGRVEQIAEFTGYPDYDLNSIGLFAQGEWNITDRFATLGGIRYERFNFGADDFTNFGGAEITGGEVDFDDVLFNIGTVYDVTNSISVFANFAQGFSAPDFDNIFQGASDDFVVSEGFEDLQAQTVDEYEIGIRGNWNQVQASLSAFYNYSELGSRLVEGDGRFFVLQRSPQRNYGIEGTVDWQATDDLQVGGIVSWNEGEFEDDETGDFLPLGRFDIQPLKLTAYIQHETTPGWTNRLQFLYVGDRDRAFDEGVDPVAIEGYFLVDYITSIRVGQGQLEIGIENLFDHQYRPVYSQALRRPIDFFAGRGRTFNVRYSIDW